MSKRRRGRILVIAAAVSLVSGGAAAARLLRSVDVTVVPVVRGRVFDAVYATGTVEAERRVVVKAKSQGAVAGLAAFEGDEVREGQMLARVDNPSAAFELRRSQVEAEAASAQAGGSGPRLALVRAQAAALSSQLEAARREADRTESLRASGAVGRAEGERARDLVAQLGAQLEAKRAEERAERIALSADAGRARALASSAATRVADTEVRAPLEGVILARYVEEGEVVAQNQALFKVGDARSLLLEVAVDETDVARVHDGEGGRPASAVAVGLQAFPGKAFRGHVAKVMPDADREKKTYLVKVRLDEPVSGLRSGMTAEVNVIESERAGALLVPADAVSGGQAWVVRGGRAERRKVELGIRDLLRAEVLSGLDEGDEVVVSGQDKLSREGERVRAAVKAPGAPEGAARAGGPSGPSG